jgi:CRP-like cAMP-binding protein
MVTSLLSNISKHISLGDGENDLIHSLVKYRSLERKEVLLQAGQSCNTFNYVVNGALRAFFRTADDKEATIMFAISDWWITDMPCFLNRQPAMISIEAIEHSEIGQLSIEDLDLLYEKIPQFERFMRIMMQNAYVREQLRTIQNLSLSAEERYINFVKKYPDIVRKVSNKHIASYLGITPEFLSVIRSRKK